MFFMRKDNNGGGGKIPEICTSGKLTQGFGSKKEVAGAITNVYLRQT
jgi:hypothetical protein